MAKRIWLARDDATMTGPHSRWPRIGLPIFSKLCTTTIDPAETTKWVKSVVSDLCGDVRFTPESDRSLRCREMTLCAISDQSGLQQNYALFDNLVGGPWGRP